MPVDAIAAEDMMGTPDANRKQAAASAAFHGYQLLSIPQH